MEPPEPVSLALGLFSITFAALLCVVSHAADVATARSVALADSAGSTPRLTRLSRNGPAIRGRWSVLQAAFFAGGLLLLLRSLGPAWAIGIATMLSLVVSRIGHGLLVAHATDRLPFFLVLLRPLEWLVAPLADPVTYLCRFTAQSNGAPPANHSDAETNLAGNGSERSTTLADEQSAMIRNVLEFSDTVAGDLMVPRPQVTAIDINTSPQDLIRLIRQNEHSRYPVYRDRIDNIVGILHVKDVFLHVASHGISKLNLRPLLRKAVFIPETQLASSVLQQLRAGRHHMAIVIDEFGGMSGVLTLEDLLEEIVGEIRDEYDDEESPVIQLSNGHFVVDASIPITELNRHVGIELPDGGEYNSLGGFIVEIMGRVPESGAVLEEMGHRFLIQSSDERHISKVEIVPNPAAMRASA